ncbi:MAG: hypothetical protein COX29_01835 [Candidatus Moranbacteria bacterium CG23_combo_of_CG06-09_8_20_14_all_35_22]|nr:MAG: hypothetical protein COX29_01835 [Candidatus Moranbacteria bacterium CG23_combo_of_CG06-09_8_20_14_all_35_22]
MITLNEKAKKVLTIVGIVIAVVFLWGVFNLFTGKTNNVLRKSSSNLNTAGISSKGFDGSMGLANPMADDFTSDSSPMMMEENFSESAVESSIPVDKKIIKNGSLNLKVEKTETAVQKISEIVKKQGGEVFSTDFFERVKGQKSGSLTVKVPVEKFEDTIAKIKETATQVISESTSGQDVMEQYSDLQIQVKNKKAEEESFVKILERAGEIEDVLKVTQQIARVRGEIERLEGRIRLMNSQTDMSTITIDVSEDIEIAPISNDWRPIQVIKKSFSELIESLQDFVDGLIRFVIVTLPSLIVFLLIIWIFYLIGKRIFQKLSGKK